jgi:hypothetical protein
MPNINSRPSITKRKVPVINETGTVKRRKQSLRHMPNELQEDDDVKNMKMLTTNDAAREIRVRPELG